jgi:uroporphyrinogen decarboxylase
MWDPVGLKREFGEEITFWGGGCDTQRVLPFMPPEKVKEHVKELVEIFKPGGASSSTESITFNPKPRPRISSPCSRPLMRRESINVKV